MLSVVAFHAFPTLMKGGFIGVDIFFVISGFLISTIIFENLDRGTFSFTEFYARRIKRIFPALLLVLIASFAFGWFALLADEYKHLGKHIAAGAGFVSNLVLWSEAGYFDNSAETKPLLHLWSLGIEEQFYIVWPFVLWFSWKRKFNLLTLTVLVALISFSLNLKGIKQDSVATFYSPQTRFWELLSGSLLAWFAIYKKNGFHSNIIKIDCWLAKVIIRESFEADGKTLSNVIAFTGSILLAYGFWGITKDVSFPGKWAAIPVIGAVLIILAGPKAWINRKILSNKLAVWFGLISFPLYLWHWPLLSFARIVEGEEPSLSIRIAAVLLSVVLAWLTYKFVERPIRFGKGGKAKVTVLVILMAVVGYFGFNSYERDGLKFRLKQLNAIDKIFANPHPKISYFSCDDKMRELSTLEFDGECRLSKNLEPTILFLGDSHTAHYINAVWETFRDDTILMIVQTSCLPFSNSQMLSGECRKKYTSVLDYLERNKSIKTVVLSGYWSYLISGGFEKLGENWRQAKAPNKENTESFKLNAREFIFRTLATGKDVIVFKDIPDLDFNIEECFDSRPLRISAHRTRANCWIDEKDFYQRLTPYDKVMNEILDDFPSIKTFDSRKYLCANGKCLASNGSLPYYWNGDHLNYLGAKKIIEGFYAEHFER